MSSHFLVLSKAEVQQHHPIQLDNFAAVEHAAKSYLSDTIKHVLLSVGCLENSNFYYNYWTNGVASVWLSSVKSQQHLANIDSSLLSVLIEHYLAQDYSTIDAVVLSTMQHQQLQRSATPNSVKQLQWPEQQIDLPYLANYPLIELPKNFLDCGAENLGLYPIVDSFYWVKRLLPTGIKTLQLRIKNFSATTEQDIQASIALARQAGVRLFINDYWEIAIRHNAYGVHLGQEDLEKADIKKIQQAGLRLGISTHNYAEVARAHAYHPSYLACGPIYATNSKIMAAAPQGLTQLARWRRTLDYPLVAIGGINLPRLPAVLATGVSNIALISAITEATDPLAMTQQLLTLLKTTS